MWNFIKKKPQKNERQKIVSTERLTAGGKLPAEWISQNSHIIKPYENKLVEMAIATKRSKDEECVKALQELIQYYYEFKSFCYRRGECSKKYFQDMWEHCHNSRCNDFEYIKPYEEKLNELLGK